MPITSGESSWMAASMVAAKPFSVPSPMPYSPSSVMTLANSQFFQGFPAIYVSMARMRIIPIIDDAPVEDRQINTGIGNLHWIDTQDVVREHDQVGQLAGLNRSLDTVIEAGVRRPHGVGANRLGDGDLLFRNPPAQV